MNTGNQTTTTSPRWHATSTEEVLGTFDSSTEGLSTGSAATRLSKYGPNRLPETKQRSALMRFLAQFHNVLIYVLIAVGLLVIFQLGFTYIPMMQSLFGTAALDIHTWGVIIVVTFSVLWLVELEKIAVKRLVRRPH